MNQIKNIFHKFNEINTLYNEIFSNKDKKKSCISYKNIALTYKKHV